jgi:uncharacterized protein (TIGR02611 family)
VWRAGLFKGSKASSSPSATRNHRVRGVRPVMFKGLKQEWAQLKRGEPGSRFQDQFDRNRKEAKSKFGRGLRVVAGVALLPVGLFMLAVPGPGLVVIAIGAVLIAREFRWAARLLDRLEVRGRKVARWAKRRWRRLRGPQTAGR